MSGKNNYQPIIGAEIHVELNTKSKMFCGCKNDPFGADKPNIYTCPVCLGLPGALPVPNTKAIDHTIMIGLALNCKIGNTSTFDRKHYFYPDLAKGYQISQQAKPLCYDGYVNTSHGKVRINRVHLEEDTAKLIHDKIDGKRVSLIDFNRSGVPLVEIVTEPDIKSAEQAKEFLKSIRQTVRDLKISDADMEKGSMRLEANISLSEDATLPDYKVEVKNINSFRFYAQAVEYEIKRQSKILETGKLPPQETRGWDEKSNTTVFQRSKESSQEYGYFPEPDIPPLNIAKKRVENLKNNLPETHKDREEKLRQLNVREDYLPFISYSSLASGSTVQAAKLLESNEAYKGAATLEDYLNYLVNKKPKLTKDNYIDLPEEFLESKLKSQHENISDFSELEKVINQVIDNNQKVAEDYKSGKVEALGFLMGQVMKMTQGKANAKKASDLLKQSLSK